MKKEKSDSCMESRSDFQKEENKLFLSLFLCVYMCVWLTMEMVWRFSKGIDLRVECVPAAL